MVPDLVGVMGMRAAGERARWSDLEGLLHRVPSSRRELLRRRIVEQAGGRDVDGGDAALTEEVMAQVTVGLVREANLDAGVFDVAEMLLHELCRAGDLPRVVLAHTPDAEVTDHDRGAVAMRFPGSRVWDLPILAHEFGHHAVRHLEASRTAASPFRGVLADVAAMLAAPAEPGPGHLDHAEELVSDAIATVVCGSSYPVATLCLRAHRGARSARSSTTHPSWRDRVATMAATLDTLSSRTARTGYRAIREDVVDPLATTVLGVVPPLSPPTNEAAQRSVDILTRRPTGLVYGDADTAVGIARALDRGEPPLGPATAVRALLDGAWRWRLAHPRSPREDAVAALAVRGIHDRLPEGSR